MDYKELAFMIGRVVLGLYLLKNAYAHFTRTKTMAAYAGSKNVPSPVLAVVVAGLLLLIGGVGILLGRFIEWSVLALVFFFIPVTFTMHRYWKETDPSMKAIQSVNFYKNLAVLGAVLMLLIIREPWPYSF